MTRKKTRKVPKPKPRPLKVDKVMRWESDGHHVKVHCKDQLVELATKLKQPIFYEDEEE